MFNTELYKLISSINENTFIVSDTHFFHENVLKYEPSRVEAMKKDGFTNPDEWMIHKWNQTVGKDDLVLHIGDFAFKGIDKLKGRLNGKKILILGNHDRKGKQTYNDIFDYVLRGSHVLFNDRLYIAESTDDLFSTLITTINNKCILISHYPASNQEKRYYHDRPGKMLDRLDAIMRIADENSIEVNIHGHTHSKDIIDDEQMYDFINVSFEKTNFAPIKIKDILINE